MLGLINTYTTHADYIIDFYDLNHTCSHVETVIRSAQWLLSN